MNENKNNLINKPAIIQGGSYTDDRGEIRFVNDFKFTGVNRFYTIHHPDRLTVRAWQGHIQESKYYYPIKGAWLIAWVRIDLTIPEDQWELDHVILNSAENKLLYLPFGFAVGIKALENDSIITGFSVSGNSDETILRWDANKWFDWNSFKPK